MNETFPKNPIISEKSELSERTKKSVLLELARETDPNIKAELEKEFRLLMEQHTDDLINRSDKKVSEAMRADDKIN